jgi:hypothetical protein
VSDLWTSKNSVYAFAGVVGFWIDDGWNLNESIIELLPLSGDHSGSASGKLIFKALNARGIETKLSTSFKHASILILIYRYSTGANGADNASSNGPLNRKLSKLLWRASGYHIDAKNMQIGCAGHGLNIGAQ